MLHGAIFDNVNTLQQYGLCLLDDLSIETAKRKENIVDIPGADGELDLSDLPQGYPVYSNREITFTLFKGVDDVELMQIRDELVGKYSGKTVELKLPNDNYEAAYSGVVQIGDISGYNSGKIPITINAKPFKHISVSASSPAGRLTGAFGITNLGKRPAELFLTVQGESTIVFINSITMEQYTFTSDAEGYSDVLTDYKLPIGNVGVSYQLSRGTLQLTWEEERL